MPVLIRYLLVSCLLIVGLCPIAIADPGTATSDTVLDAPWTKLADGLAYQIRTVGTGERVVKLNDYVTIVYVAYVKDAKQPFARTQPDKGMSFQVGKSSILPGMQRGIVGMKIGEQRKLYIPPALGFGNRNAKGVPPASVLIVEMKVVNILSPVTWEVLEKGDGKRTLKNGDVVSVNYVGKLEDGTIFDSNQSAASPFRFGVGSRFVIVGYSRGVQGMTVGEKRRLTIPPHFAYGKQERSKIPANSTLIFDIQCLAIDQGVKFQTTRKGRGPAMTDGMQGEFALLLQTITGKTIVDTQFAKPLKFKLNPSIDPVGLYYMALGMKEGEVRQGVIARELGLLPGKTGSGQDLKVTLDLVKID